MKVSSCCRRLTCLVFTLLFLITSNLAFSQDAGASEIPTDEGVISSGQTIFKNNCKQCHSVHEQVIGPALKEVYTRRPLPWIQGFIRNSQGVIQSGDDYAVKLFEKFKPAVMPSFDFSDEEILSIMAYVKHETENPPVAAGTEAAADGGTAAAQGGTVASGYVTFILVALVIVLVLILVVLGVLISVVTKYIKQKEQLDEADQELVDQRFSLAKLAKSSGFIWIVTFVFTAIVLKTVVDGLFTIGVQQGYEPTQPIAFSHKLHAGDFKIDCNYCHTGVRKSKNANIPSPNICMNCHSGITKVTGATEPSKEIQKIYGYIERGEPIEWVRVHNLPDLAYFNHAQHVKVGGIECQTCHGPVETMEVVAQNANLTMGWCINCHRETQIKADNSYYDKLVELHSEKSNEPMVVKDIGGLECAKCHY